MPLSIMSVKVLALVTRLTRARSHADLLIGDESFYGLFSCERNVEARTQ